MARAIVTINVGQSTKRRLVPVTTLMRLLVEKWRADFCQVQIDAKSVFCEIQEMVIQVLDQGNLLADVEYFLNVFKDDNVHIITDTFRLEHTRQLNFMRSLIGKLEANLESFTARFEKFDTRMTLLVRQLQIRHLESHV